MAPIEIHRGIFDVATNQIVDPAICRFQGYINSAPITVPKSGNSKDGSSSEGGIDLECVSRSRILTKTSGQLFSDETLKKRSGDRFGRYLDMAGQWRVWWGQETKEIGGEKKPIKERFLR
jgi:hypothetical protein